MSPNPDVVLYQKILKKVGTTPLARAQWLLWFGQQDPYVLARLELEELREFVGQLNFFTNSECRYTPEVDERARKRLLHWQYITHNKIKLLKRGYPWIEDYVTKYKFRLPPKTSAQTHLDYTSQTRCTFEPDVSYQICLTLVAVSSRLRRCFSFDCQNIFIQRGRQRYCSKQCGQTHRTRQHRLLHDKNKGKRKKYQRWPKGALSPGMGLLQWASDDSGEKILLPLFEDTIPPTPPSNPRSR